MKRLSVTIAVLATLVTMDCVYYNAMWSAKRFAKQARKAEGRGEDGAARAFWMQAAAKAESVHVNHRSSKWADDAIVLHAEALVRAGQCPLATAILDTAFAVARVPAHRERVALAAATCALRRNRPDEVPALVAPALASADGPRRSRAHLLTGDAAAARGDATAALEHYRQSREPQAGPASVRLLLALDRGPEAIAQLQGLARGRFAEPLWTALLDETARAVGALRASPVLDHVLARMRVPEAARGRMLLADGDRLFAVGAFEAAAARYATAAQGLPGQPETDLGAVRVLKAQVAAAAGPEDLADVAAALERAGGRPGSASAAEAARFGALLSRVTAPETTEVATFHAAELTRDSLHAAALAARLFYTFAERHPESLFAPKALVAALVLEPGGSGEVRERLRRDYAGSPYTLALYGEASPGYGAAEDSLARALGVPLERPRETYVALIADPLPGPLGPWEDWVFRLPQPAAITADSLGPDDLRLRQRRGQPVRPRPAPPDQPRPQVRP